MRTNESERDGRYHFEVEAQLPLGLGLLVKYEGWLEKDRRLGERGHEIRCDMKLSPHVTQHSSGGESCRTSRGFDTCASRQ